MNHFIVSARKYRPQTFETVVGQSHITTTLKNAIKNQHLAHAFLFCGPRGVGKTTCARILAKTINCENLQPDGEACNECSSCKSFNDGASLNIHELDAASNNSVEDIRTLVEQVRFAPQAGKYKVYIVDEVHMLSASAFNAFLKTLEEPPAYAIFILATTEKHKILPTILSRCQIFDFKRITINDTVEHLEGITHKESINAEKAALQVIAQKSEGCMRDALSILDKIVSFTNGTVTYKNTLEHLNVLDHDYYFKLLEYLSQQDLASAMLLFDEINNKGFEGDMVLNGFAEFLRNLMVCKDPKSIALLDVVEGMSEKYQTTAQQIQTAYIIAALNILTEAEINYKQARNKRLHVEMALVKLNFLPQALELTQTEAGVVKKKRLDTAVIKKQPIPTVKPKTNTTALATNIKTASENAAPKLYIQPKPANEVKPLTESTAAATQVAPVIQLPKKNPTAGGKKNLLDLLKGQLGDGYLVEEIKEASSLNEETLLKVWNNYAHKLSQEHKYSAANAFKTAKLKIKDDLTFEVEVYGNTHQKFIEQEKVFIADEIQNAFNNRGIQFKFNVIEPAVNDNQPKLLTSYQKFELMAQQYPLIEELKKQLNLEIE